MRKINLFITILAQMGFRYVAYRFWFAFKAKSGILKSQTPQNFKRTVDYDFESWKMADSFFFSKPLLTQDQFKPSQPALDQLKENANRIKKGETLFFHSEWKNLGNENDWVTNPITGYKYDVNLHWSQIPDFDPQKGDIKYVWEKSRFTFLHDLIRDDFWNHSDHFDFVFSTIEDWLTKNPINSGPNYKCAQEISVRLLNWCFALNYYKNDPRLDPKRWHRIVDAIHKQTQHVDNTLNFSLFCVRNNHAITESFCLFAMGHLFPDFPEAEKWKKKGKKHLEEEILYQFYADGSYLQFSTNYQRVALQICTWALVLGEKWKNPLHVKVKERIKTSLHFMLDLMDESSGFLPNYGANDGALFFKLNTCPFRDFRPQLNALHTFFHSSNITSTTDCWEDSFWYGTLSQIEEPKKISGHGWKRFDTGGFYTFRNQDLFLMLRSGSHKDRPSQADNHHLDLWFKGNNLLRDNGSYLYNTEAKFQNYFFGTASHNTMMLGDENQMKKEARFIWTHWSQQEKIEVSERQISSTLSLFKHLAKSIKHTRSVAIAQDLKSLEVYDEIIADENVLKTHPPCLIWHLANDFEDFATLQVFDENRKQLSPQSFEAFHSSHYGQKTPSKALKFLGNKLTTQISFH